MRKLFLIIFLVIIQSVSADSKIRTYPPEVLFKNYALSSCLADAFDDETLRKDASATAAAYLEFGTGPLEAYTAATLLGREYIAREYRGKASVAFGTMKCVDFYHSDQLDELMQKYINSPAE